ncbi:hypothetical protein Aperf_G00000091068 [Anoplocephala perfoliata]
MKAELYTGNAEGHLCFPRRIAVIESQCYMVCGRGQDRWRLQISTPNGHFVRTIPLHDCHNFSSALANGDEIVAIDTELSAMIAYVDDYTICDYKEGCSFASISGHYVVGMVIEDKYKMSNGGDYLTDYRSGVEISRGSDVLVQTAPTWWYLTKKALCCTSLR